MSEPQPASARKPGTESGEGKSRYRSTLNLPETPFPMKGNLVQNEPASLKRWEKIGLYARIRAARAGREKFTFHDGPPYANGNIHLGHLMNKCIKDFVVRSRTQMGMDCPYVPGWDCHGLPIEHKVMTELQEAGKLARIMALDEGPRKMAVRRECQKYAEKFHRLHTQQMQRLLTLADYANPYLTMKPGYEGAVLEVLASLMEQGLVYRAVKPVHWSIANETALAEAELEYYDREDISVYVDFEAVDPGAVYDAFGLGREEEEEKKEITEAAESDAEERGGGDWEGERGVGSESRPAQKPTFMIWTTTPWTLPANVAIAVNPEFEYSLVRVDGNVTVIASELVDRVTKAAGAESVERLAATSGRRLLGLRYRHPFAEHEPQCALQRACSIDMIWSIVPAEYVTLEDGTGLVHTAPGHGQEDYQTGLKFTLPVYCPVRHDGAYDQTVPAWLRGMDIWKANPAIVKHLRDSGHLFYEHAFTHSYPHDWRSKTPVIFRCTEQWFAGVDQGTARDGRSLRLAALHAVDSGRVAFVPEWGRNRMRGMLESRPDWCISRQRAWGLPIPAFLYEDAQGRTQALMTPATIRAVAAVVRAKGSDAWFQSPVADLLAGYDAAGDKDAPEEIRKNPGLALGARKGPDILDVWFESGSSWNAVLRDPERHLGYPADLYLEGSDQHRGWFQLSLLPALGVTGVPPFKTLLTHGFIVDRDGRKLSKSRPDAHRYEVESLCAEFGMDVMRWWVCSLAYENDVKADVELFALAGESYRKVRNTLRFMLSNLSDYYPQKDAGTLPAPGTIDAWGLGEYDALAGAVVRAYEAFDFKGVHQRIFDFCNETLSAVYLAAVKDRLYCDAKDSPRRRRTQGVLWRITDGLCRLLAPVLCHTADEAYRTLHRAADDQATVHTEEFVRAYGVRADAGWTRAMSVRQRALAAMESARKEMGVDNPLDMGVVLPDPEGALARFERADLADLLGVSEVTLDPAAPEVRVLDLRERPRCERSWKRDGTVRPRSDGGLLSDRDAAVLGV